MPRVQQYLSIEEVAEALGLSTRTVRRLIATGDLPVYRLARGRKIKVKAEDIERAVVRIPASDSA